MSNTIKYNTVTDPNTLKSGNFNIGVNNVGYGSEFFNTIPPPAGGYTIYINRGNNERSIYVAYSDEELVLMKDNFGGVGDTADAILSWASQQDDILILNKQLDNVVTDGLVLYLDADSVVSYPRSGTTWTDLSGSGNTGTLVNGPTFSGDSIVFDGADDYMITSTISNFKSIGMWVYYANTGPNPTWRYLIDARPGMVAGWFVPSNTDFGSSWSSTIYINGNTTSISSFPFNRWVYLYLKTTGLPYTSTINFMSRYSGNEQAGGKIESIQIYDRILTEKEIQLNYYKAPIVTDGLVLAVDAGNLVSYESGSTTTYSMTGSIVGTLQNGTAYSSDNGGIWDLDGTNDYLSFDSNSTRTNLGISNYFTFDVWINADSAGDQFGFPGYDPYWGYTMRTVSLNSNTKLAAYLYYQDSDGNWVSSYNTSSINRGDIGQWVNFVITFDNGLVTHYVNGNKGTSTTLALSGQNPTRNLQYGIAGWGYYNGKFSNGRVYNRSLSDSEVLQNFNAQKSRFGL